MLHFVKARILSGDPLSVPAASVGRVQLTNETHS